MSALLRAKEPSTSQASGDPLERHWRAILVSVRYSVTRSSREGAEDERILSFMRASRLPYMSQMRARPPSRPARPLIWLNSADPMGRW